MKQFLLNCCLSVSFGGALDWSFLFYGKFLREKITNFCKGENFRSETLVKSGTEHFLVSFTSNFGIQYKNPTMLVSKLNFYVFQTSQKTKIFKVKLNKNCSRTVGSKS